MATIAVDFDGTIVTHEYPKIGTELPFATETLKMLIRDHHKLILWSVREGKLLDEAVEWCRERGVEFWAVNKDYPEESLENNNHFSRKLKADWFIDDRGIGGFSEWGGGGETSPAPSVLLCGQLGKMLRSLRQRSFFHVSWVPDFV